MFEECIHQVVTSTDKEVLDDVFSVIVLRVYNARCNEYLRAISNDIERKDNKTADVNVGLRDKLKAYAAEKEVPK